MPAVSLTPRTRAVYAAGARAVTMAFKIVQRRNRRRFDLRLLRLFPVIVRLHHITVAVEQLQERIFDLSEGALRTAVSRLWKQFGEQLRLEIARTVSAPHEIEEEFQCLRAFLGART